MTLTNHYRCLEPIIEICNRMVYDGELSVATRTPTKLWRPELKRLGFLVTDEVVDTKNPGGSRRNQTEAECIAQWIYENEASIVKHYSTKNVVGIEDVLAIVTPFSGQKLTLKKALAKQYKQKWDERDMSFFYNRMTIDTVHTLQGAERQIVIFSMVETNDPGNPQFYDKGANLINVAISRAKEMFVVAMTQKAVNYARKLTDNTLKKPSDYLWQAVVANGSRLNSRRLIIVESPNKCSVIKGALGDSIEVEVLATVGHIAKLEEPQNWNAMDANKPAWGSLSDTGVNVFARTETLWPDLEALYLATDPDPEGEAIAWHILRILGDQKRTGNLSTLSGKAPLIKRMRFFNLVGAEVGRAYDSASDGLDAGMVKSALARGLLDYLIATQYPTRLGLGSANSFEKGIGRVQLGILDLVHQAMSNESSYAVIVSIPLKDGSVLISYALDPNTNKVDGVGRIWQTPKIESADKAAQLIQEKLNKVESEITVQWNTEPLQQYEAYPGLNTARLLALAWRSKRLAPSQVMAVLQDLYEGTSAVIPSGFTSKKNAFDYIPFPAGTMDNPHTSAHPILEPLNYELSPEDARAFLKDDQLKIYELLWNAGIATAMDGPALRHEVLEVKLSSSIGQPTADLSFLAVQTSCINQGWGELLPSEIPKNLVSTPNIATAFPEILTDALDSSGQWRLDGTGRRIRSAKQCEQLVSLMDSPNTWKTETARMTHAALSMDQTIELMAGKGIGRPSTFADRLSVAIENKLVLHEVEPLIDHLLVGEYGKQILAALNTLPADAVVGADFSNELEQSLKAVETDHSLAGNTLRQFCERALGTSSPLADWLDELVIEGESLNEFIARTEAILPPANSWSSFVFPAGINPEQLARNPDELIVLREELDSILAAQDRKSWRRRSPRQRAVCRLVALAKGNLAYLADDLTEMATRDIVLRWWIDLPPQDSPLTKDEFRNADSILAGFGADIEPVIRNLVSRINQSL